jgi:Flp pilus assembly protein TadD
MAAAPEAEPVAEEQPEMFHVEPVSAPMTRSRRAVSLDVAELRSLRARLAAEEHGAADVLMTVQTRLAGRAPDRDLARLLGEAHLRLGQHGAAAAHFRQAMLHGVRERTENLASQPR